MPHTVLLVLAAAIAADRGPEMPEPLESCDDPVPMHPPATTADTPLPSWMTATGSTQHVQVNLNEDGLNILGDAANEPTIAVDPTAPNRMAICWRQFDTIQSSFRQAGYSWSNDGGRTWSPIDRIMPGIFRSDPVLVSGPGGAFHFMSLEVPGFNVFHHLSEDGGRTWGDPTFAFGGDKQWLAVHPNGVTLIHHWSNSLNRSPNAGELWEDPAEWVPSWGNSAFGPDGTYYVIGRHRSAVKLGLIGDPLAPVLTIDSLRPVQFDGAFVSFGGPNPGGLLGMPQVAVNSAPGPYHGEVYAIAPIAPNGTADPSDLRFSRSTDGGATWLDTPVTINDDPPGANNWQWFGTMSIAPDGRLDVVWLDTRNDPDPDDSVFISQLFYAFSPDGGRTWSPNIPLSVGFDSHLGWPSQNKMGDYFHMVSDKLGADLAWAATFEGEQNVYYTRIGPRDCNGNGIPDEDEIAAGTTGDCDGDGIPDECEIAAGVDVPCVGCPADLAEPFGVLDLADLVAFIDAFTSGDTIADFAEPFGILDLADIGAFLQSFIAGCP